MSDGTSTPSTAPPPDAKPKPVTIRTGLCVGGPWDGRRTREGFAGRLEIVIPPKIDLSYRPPGATRKEPSYETFEYTAVAIVDGKAKFLVWAPKGATLSELLTDLLGGYRQPVPDHAAPGFRRE